jgi:glutamyl-tRNA reductase
VTELRRALARLPAASEETREAMESMSTAIVNKFLHTPITKLRESRRAGTSRSSMDLVQELFGLGGRA